MSTASPLLELDLELASTTLDPSLNLTSVKGANVQFMLYDYLIPGIGTLIIVLNLIVVISSGLILRSGLQPKATYLFMGNVAMSDLVTGAAVVLGQVVPKGNRTEGLCALSIGMIVSSTLASVWSVALIAIDRFYYIVHGIKYNRLVFPRRSRIFIALTWLLGLIIGFLPAMGWTGKTDGGKICWFIRLAPPPLVIITTVVGIIPIAIVIALYSIILYHALRKVMQIQRADKDAETGARNHKEGELRVSRGGNKQGKSSPKRLKSIKVVMFTTGSFVITWMPYFVACCLYVLCENPDDCKPLRLAIASPLAILGFCNSLLNPIIYAWWHAGFRAFIRKQLDRFRPKPKSKAPDTKTSVSSNTKSTMLSSKNSTSSDSYDTKL